MSEERPRVYITQPVAESAIRRLAERAEVAWNREPLNGVNPQVYEAR